MSRINNLRAYTEQIQARANRRDSKGRKKCTMCAQWKAEDDFRGRPERNNALSSRCKGCDVARDKRTTASRHGLSQKQNTALGTTCKNRGCSKRNLVGSDRCIDHDHTCCPGKYSCGRCVRGILCRECNKIEGILRKNKVRIAGISQYLRSFSHVRNCWH